MASYWNQIRLIYKELDLVSNTFFVKSKPFENHETGVQTCICLFNYANFIKVTVSWRISPKSVLQFPDNGSEELHVKLHYGPVS